MSHLRPDQPHGHAPKPYGDYTKEERESVIIEIENASRGRAADPATVALAHRLRDEYKGADGVVLGGRELDINTQHVTPANGGKALQDNRRN